MAREGEFGRLVLLVQANDEQLIQTLNRDQQLVAAAAANMQGSLDGLSVQTQAYGANVQQVVQGVDNLSASSILMASAFGRATTMAVAKIATLQRLSAAFTAVIGATMAFPAAVAVAVVGVIVFRKEILEAVASLELWYNALNAIDPDPGFGARLGRAHSFLQIRRMLTEEERLLLGQVTPLDLVRDKLLREHEARVQLRFDQRQANVPPDEYAPPPRLTVGQIEEIIVRKQRILELEERTRDAIREQAALEARIKGREPRTAREARDAILLAVQEMQRLSAARARMERVYQQYVTAMGLVGSRAPEAVRLAEALGLLKTDAVAPGALTTRAVSAFAFPGGGRFGGAGAPDPMAQRRQQMAEERTKRARWSEEHLRAIKVAVETGGGAGP